MERAARDDGRGTAGRRRSSATASRIDGALLVHAPAVGLADAVVLDALAGGCDGIMSAVCEEGAALGHAGSSAVAAANLARLGNRDVATRYNLRGIVEAARRVTRLTTGAPVAVRQVVYDPRAVEAVFGFTAVGGGTIDPTFDRDADGRLGAQFVFLADILGVAEKPVRLHTLATPAQFAARLRQCFGADARFDDALGARLKDGARNARRGEKAEYTSAIGLAVLYQRVTGILAPAMVACVEEAAATQQQNDAKHKVLLAQAEDDFQTALRAEGAGDADGLPFESFIANFVHAAYLGGNHNTFGTCGIDGAVLEAVHKHFDLDSDSVITFEEWRVWLIWAPEHPRRRSARIRSIPPSSATRSCLSC